MRVPATTGKVSSLQGNLDAAHRRFMADSDPARKVEAGKDLIRAVFGKGALAEDALDKARLKPRAG